MKNITIENIVNITGGRLSSSSAGLNISVEAEGVCIDSRLVEEKYIFIATKGERVDGHDYIPQAFEKGALAVVCEHVPENVKGPCIEVGDSLLALKEIAEFYRQQLDIKVVGITGSVGKTSTKEFIASVLEEKYRVLKTEGNFNNEIGLPLTICRIRPEHEVAVLEMGISDFGEMTRLAKMARPDVAVITNIGQCHLENLKDRNGVLSAKTEIFKYLKEDGTACLFADDDKLITVREVNGKEPLFFGTNKELKVHPLSITPKGLLGSDCTIACKDSVFMVHIPLPGIHRLYNTLAAVAVGYVLGLGEKEMIAGIEKIKATPGRGNVIRTENLTILDDCYNANPVSMNAAIDMLTLAEERKVAVLGDMFELGEEETWMHEGVGKYAVTKELDAIYCIGNLGRSIYEGARNEASKHFDEKEIIIKHFPDKEEFFKHMKEFLRKGDAVLVKASHGMHFEEIVEKLKEW